MAPGQSPRRAICDKRVLYATHKSLTMSVITHSWPACTVAPIPAAGSRDAVGRGGAVKVRDHKDGGRVTLIDTVLGFEKAIETAGWPDHRTGRGRRAIRELRSSTAQNRTTAARRQRTAGSA